MTTLGRCIIMGVLNVTPDSFSDGGMFADTPAAVDYGIELAQAGADLVDVGGESTRPGASRVSEAEELDRVIPVIQGLSREGISTSVDTMRATVAAAAVAEGASVVNDVSGGLADADMAATVAPLDVDFVAMHWRAHSTHMDARDTYGDVVAEVGAELHDRIGELTAAGIKQERIIVDPGLGFSKVTDSNWPLLAHLSQWSHGQRVLVGASRKRFLGAVATMPDRELLPAREREPATTAVTALAAFHGVWGVRVHDPGAAYQAIQVANAWRNALGTAR